MSIVAYHICRSNVQVQKKKHRSDGISVFFYPNHRYELNKALWWLTRKQLSKLNSISFKLAYTWEAANLIHKKNYWYLENRKNHSSSKFIIFTRTESFSPCLTLFFCPINFSILINWTSPFPNFGCTFSFLFQIEIPVSKRCRPWSEVRSAASDLGLHCLPRSQKWDTRHEWVNCPRPVISSTFWPLYLQIYTQFSILTSSMNNKANQNVMYYIGTRS